VATPGPFHSPDAEGVAEALVGQERTGRVDGVDGIHSAGIHRLHRIVIARRRRRWIVLRRLAR